MWARAGGDRSRHSRFAAWNLKATRDAACLLLCFSGPQTRSQLNSHAPSMISYKPFCFSFSSLDDASWIRERMAFVLCFEFHYMLRNFISWVTYYSNKWNSLHKYINMSDYQGCEWFSKRLANYMNMASRSLRGGREGFLHTASGVHCTYTLHMRVHRTTAYSTIVSNAPDYRTNAVPNTTRREEKKR